MGSLIIIIVVVLAAAGLFILWRFRLRAARDKRPSPKGPKPGMLDNRAIASLVASGQLQEAYESLVSQGDFRGAARVALRMQQYLRAAELFERVGDSEAAANAYIRIPDFRRAAQCHARAGRHDKAAELYVQVGDLWAAAEELIAAGRLKHAAALYRQSGDEQKASRLEADALRQEGQHLEAAKKYEAVGDHENAARCYEEAQEFRSAARSWLASGRPDLAAALMERCGADIEAAALYEEAGDHISAARLYQKVQNPDKEIEALVAAGELLPAAHLAYKLGEKDRAEQILLLSAPGDRGYARACLLLGKILDEENRHQEALRFYTQFIERATPTDKNREVFLVLANMFERDFKFETAFSALMKLDEVGLLPFESKEALERLRRRVGDTGARSSPLELPNIGRDPREIVPEVLADRYQVLRRLGEGGTAVVYLAHDKKLRRDVVLKFLSNPCLPGDLAVDYFLREAQIIASMSHPNIVHVYDVGDVGGRLYMVLEFLEGQTLDVELARTGGKGLDWNVVVNMAKELASALDYAHERKVIHRDIKPGNIMLLPDGHVKLMDFGMAKALEIHRDRSLYICGTPDYMSPEQECGLDLGPATDIYSFGLVLLESLLGMLPHGSTAMSAREARLEALRASTLPEKVKSILEKSLAIEPAQRPKTAGELVLALSDALSEGLRK